MAKRSEHEENLAVIRGGQGVTIGSSYFTRVKDYCEFYDLEIPEQDREPEPEVVEESEPELTGFERWNLTQHVQIGDGGQVRSVFIGPWGDDDSIEGAPELPEILAVTKEEWETEYVPKFQPRLPEDLLERLKAVRGVGDALAATIYADLTKKPE